VYSLFMQLPIRVVSIPFLLLNMLSAYAELWLFEIGAG